jgi:uncharacterized protein (TIGR03790 family)
MNIDTRWAGFDVHRILAFIRAYSLPVFFYLILLIPSIALAAIMPEEVAVIVNRNSPESIHIGQQYLWLRNVPVENLIMVDVPVGEGISRKTYEREIAAPVREKIKSRESEGVKIRCLVTTYGIPLRVSGVRPANVADEQIQKEKDLLQQKKHRIAKLRKQGGKSGTREEIERLRNEISAIQFRLEHLSGRDSAAAVDSELALVLWGKYNLAGWLPNPEFLPIKEMVRNVPARTLVVSRIDAPTPQLAEGLIRTAIEVEKSGLAGRMYLDARGLNGRGPYAAFDERIRKTAELLRGSGIDVVLDNKPSLFGPGDAPEAVLYCGWYSLAKYVDAFEWVKGAVGYHIASAEAVSLHDSSRNYWVKSMIERGVIGTLGPVSEPYLQSFPPPEIFFPLLLSGRYSLAEVFAMSNPFLSWRMILVGDPLYSPFKNRPLYSAPDPGKAGKARRE